MKILVACEESQAVCKELRVRDHEAYSCDILDCSGGHPEWHIKADVLTQLDAGWDMMIAFPPCTHLAVSGAAWFAEKRKDGRQQAAIDFFLKLTRADIPRIAIENPVGIMSKIYRRPTQIIQPWMFGDPYQKTTCLWLKNLPRLHAPGVELRQTSIINKGEFITFASGRKMPLWYSRKWGKGNERSKTFPGIASAMAEQWGKLNTHQSSHTSKDGE